MKMCAYPYYRPRGFGHPGMFDRGFYQEPQAPGAYPWRREFYGRGRGYPSEYGGRGRGLGRGYPTVLGDLVNSAQSRAHAFKSEVSEGVRQGIDVLRNCLMDSYTGDPVYAINSALQNSNMPHLHLGFECDFLCTMGNYPIFTGVLSLTEHFLVRGLGATKESCKANTYRKAQDLIIGYTTDQVLQQEDIGEQRMCQKVFHMYTHSPNSFYDMVKVVDAPGGQDEGGFWEAPPMPGMKLPYGGAAGNASGWTEPEPDPKPVPAGWRDPNSLMQLKTTTLMKPTERLKDKLLKLKQLLKEEGITKLHLVPKIDFYAQKVAINILNAVRYAEPALRPNCPVYVEVYFDGVLMGLGEAALEVYHAMDSAYQNLADTMCRLSDFIEIVQKGRRWTQFSKMEPDICDIVPKKPGQDNGSLLTTNLANMTQMMGSGPDLTVTMDRLVLTEHEVDKDEHLFKMLELSATRNNVLLECEITRVPNNEFCCYISANGKMIGTATKKSKASCKKKCSEVIMEALLKTNDHIYVFKEYNGKVITKAELVQEATRMYQSGEPPSNYEIPQQSQERFAKCQKQTALSGSDAELSLSDRLEFTPENLAIRPLIPYMAAALYKVLDEYYLKISLEDIMINTKDMPRSHYEMINFCAIQMGFRVITRVKGKSYNEHCSLLRRTVKASDMVWICQINGGKSGRYQLKKLAHQRSEEELTKLKAAHFAHHQSLVEARVAGGERPGKNKQTEGQQQTAGQNSDNVQQSNTTGQQINNGGWLPPPGGK